MNAKVSIQHFGDLGIIRLAVTQYIKLSAKKKFLMNSTIWDIIDKRRLATFWHPSKWRFSLVFSCNLKTQSCAARFSQLLSNYNNNTPLVEFWLLIYAKSILINSSCRLQENLSCLLAFAQVMPQCYKPQRSNFVCEPSATDKGVTKLQLSSEVTYGIVIYV